ncbi:MAG: aldo/keto reductase, partial [Myxococcota bacterium]
GLAAGAAASAGAAETDAPGIRKRSLLGKTGIEIPDISFGSFSLEADADERLVHHALDRGVTHFDTAEGYTEGKAEKILGRALKGRRDQVTLTTKFWANPEHSAEHQMKMLEQSLRHLGTEYVDVYMNHAVNDVARLGPEWQRFAARAKEQGKVRAIGMSGHAPRLAQCMEHALDNQLVDVFLVAYSFAQQPSFKESLKAYLSDWLPSLDIVASQARLPELIARAHAEDVGVMVMKTLKGARLNDMRPYERPGRTYAQAAFRWVLSDPSVDGLVITMTSEDQIDEFVAASGTGEPDREDLALLARYVARNAGTSCLIGCGDCVSSCPAGVDVPDVMRMRMYDLDYGQPAIARREYARLERNAAACLGCSGQPCATACPSGVDIAGLARDTHRRLA